MHIDTHNRLRQQLFCAPSGGFFNPEAFTREIKEIGGRLESEAILHGLEYNAVQLGFSEHQNIKQTGRPVPRYKRKTNRVSP